MSEKLASQFVKATQAPSLLNNKRKASDLEEDYPNEVKSFEDGHEEYKRYDVDEGKIRAGYYLNKTSTYDDKTIDYINKKSFEDENETDDEFSMMAQSHQSLPEAYLVMPHRKRRPGFHNSPNQSMPFVPFYFSRDFPSQGKNSCVTFYHFILCQMHGSHLYAPQVMQGSRMRTDRRTNGTEDLQAISTE